MTDNPDTLRAMFQSPTLFSRFILNLKLFPYQARVLENKSKRRLIVSGRQIGKTQMLGAYAIWWGLTRPSQVILIVAPTLRQSKIMYDRVREMIERNAFVSSHTVHNTISFIEFDNHSTIYCLPAGLTGENIRGYPSNLTIVDEAPIVKDKVMQSITPGLSAQKGTLILSGTPWGKSGYFWRVFSSEDVEGDIYRYDKYIIKSEESPLIEKAFLDAERRTMTDAEFRMEYCAEFIDELDEYYPRKQLKECLDDYEYEEEAQNRDIVLGVDCARFGSDETAIIVLERLVDNVLENMKKEERLYKVIGVITEAVTTIPDIVRMTKNAIIRYHPMKVIVDETGLGAGVVDILTEDVGGGMIEGFVATGGPSRKRAYDILKIAIERQNISLCADDSKFLRQFGGYKLKKSKSLDSRLIVSKDVLGHDDLVDALVLALWGWEGGSRLAIIDEMTNYISDDKTDEEGANNPPSELAQELGRIKQEQALTEGEVSDADFWGL